jgi:formylglycine-generating enzyme required for sulfatase activity
VKLPDGWTVIVPDRARLEYAARAGVATMNPGGDREEDLDAYGWYAGNSGKAVHPVGQKKPNAWGIFDPIGNRWHWFWRGNSSYGDASPKEHAVYGGSALTNGRGNGTRLANIMISSKPEGVRFVLLLPGDTIPEGHP